MANEQRELNTIIELREQTEKVLRYLLPLLRGLEQIEVSPTEEKEAETERLLRPVRENISLLKLQKLVEELHELPYIKDDKNLSHYWTYFVDDKQNTDAFFQSQTLENAQQLTPLTAFLELSDIQLEVQIKFLGESLGAISGQASQAGGASILSSFPGSSQPPPPPVEKGVSLNSIEAARNEIRANKRAQMELAKKIYLAYQERKNALEAIPGVRPFSDKEFEDLALDAVILNSTPGITPEEVLAPLINSHIEAANTAARDAAQSILRGMSQEARLGVASLPPTEQIGITPPSPTILGVTPSKEAEAKPGVKRAEALILSHGGKLFDINQYIPGVKQFELVDLQNLKDYAQLSSIFPERDIDQFLEDSGLMARIDPNNSTAIAKLREVFSWVRDDIIALRHANGQSTKMIEVDDPVVKRELQQSLITMSKAPELGRSATLIVTALTTKGKDIKQQPAQQGSMLAAIRKEFAVNQIEGKPPGTIFNRALSVLQEAAGIKSKEDIQKQSFVQTFQLQVSSEGTSEILEASDDYAAIDFIGSSQDERHDFDELGSPLPTDQGSGLTGVNPIQQAERMKLFASTAKKIAMNPYVLGGAAIGGSVVYGLAAQGLAGGVGVGVSAGAGALTGAALGTWVFPGVGTALGALIGGVAGALSGAGAIAIHGSAAYPVSIGNFILNGGQQVAPLAGALQGGLGGPGGAIPSLASPTAGIASDLASGVVGGTKTFVSGMSSLSPAIAGAYQAAAIVAGPPIIAGILTVAVITPGILSSFLIPNVLTPSDSGRQCIDASWPTDGTIGAIEVYAGGTIHATLTGAIVPNYNPFNVPVYGGKRLPPTEGHPLSGSAVDITNKQGIDVYATYAGTAIAVKDVGVVRNSNGNLGLGAYGNSLWVAVDDPVKGRFVMIYAHMLGFSKEIPVGTPFQVGANQFIGQIGATGNGGNIPHLHYEVVGIDKWMDIRSIVPNPEMKRGDKVSRDECNTSETAGIDDNTDPLGSCGPQESFEPEPDTVSVGFASSGCDRLVNGATAYVNQLTKGFCSGFNQPRDTRLRSKIWNKSLYVERKGGFSFEQPGGDERRYSDMAWCTSLIIEVYKANYGGPGSELFNAAAMGGVVGMHGSWEAATGNAPVRASQTPISEVPLGSALFYMKNGIFTHVGMACSKTESSITSCEANSGSLHHIYETSGGIILPEYGIVWYGFPPSSLQCETSVKKPNGTLCISSEECGSGNCDTTNVPLVANPGQGVCAPNPDEISVPPVGGGAF